MALLRTTATKKNTPEAKVTSGGHFAAASKVVAMLTAPAAMASCCPIRPSLLSPYGQNTRQDKYPSSSNN